MDVERGVTRSVKESNLNPMIYTYVPGGAFLVHYHIMIYKIGGIVLGYCDDVLIREAIALFPMLMPLLLLHKTGKTGEGERQV